MKFLFLSLISYSLFAQPVYETKIYDSSFSTSSRIVIDRDEIQNSKSPNMASLLSTKANINITNTPFQPNSLFVRGGDSSQVLILIDNIPVYDASTVQRGFNLNSLNLNSVEKITVIKGSQSVWYGGQALSAVIKIDTLPRTLDIKKHADLSLGASDFRDVSVDLPQALTDQQITILRGQYQFQNAPSPVENSESRYKKRRDNIEALYLYRDDFQFNLKLSHATDRNESVTGFSRTDFKAADTDDFVISSEVNQFQMSYQNNSVYSKPFLSAGYVDAQRVFSQNISATSSTEDNQEYKSFLIPIRGELRLVNEENLKWDLGASFQKESMLWEAFKVQQAQSENEMIGTFTKWEWIPFESTSLVAGYRYDSDLSFRDVSTYQVGITYENYKLEHSTGYRLPSLYQLFSNKGNSDLNPEFSRNYSLSHDFVFNETFETSFSIFETHIENLIAGRGNPLQYFNVGRTLTRGIEASLFYKMEGNQKLSVSMGYQEPKDINTGRWLARRPLKSGSIVYSCRDQQKTWTLELVGRGERDDNINSSETVSLPGYTSLNSSYIFQLSPEFAQSMSLSELSLYFRGENLLNDKFEESYGYRNPGLQFFVGLRAGI